MEGVGLASGSLLSHMGYKNNTTFLSRNCITREIGSAKTPVDFYSISPRILFRLRGISRPLAQALSCLFEDKSKDTKRTMRDFTESGGQAMSGTETIIDAINPEVLRARHTQREQAIDHLIDAFSDKQNYMILLEIIWDSARGVFGTKPPTERELQELADDDDLDVPTLFELLTHVAAANFRSLEKWTGKWGKALGEKLKVETESEIQIRLPIEGGESRMRAVE